VAGVGDKLRTRRSGAQHENRQLRCPARGRRPRPLRPAPGTNKAGCPSSPRSWAVSSTPAVLAKTAGGAPTRYRLWLSDRAIERRRSHDRLQIGAVQHLLTESGYAALVLFAFAEACCVPIPSEVTFGFAGVLAASGRLNLALVIAIGVSAELLGSSTAYAVGRIGGRPLVDRLGRYVLLTSKDLDRAERWLSGKGEFAVTLGRAMPVVRAFTAIVAGTADMPLARFEIFNCVGTVIYTSSFAAVGYGVGYEWKRIAHDVSIAGYALVVLVVVVVAAFIVHRLRVLHGERRPGTAARPAASRGKDSSGR